MKTQEVLEAFDFYLHELQLRLDAVVIGGSALNLLGITSRPTDDCDVLMPVIPADVLLAAQTFAAELRKRGGALRSDWLNNGPMSLTSVLNPGWQARLQPAFSGKAITLQCLGRADLLCSKLFAFCDRGRDLEDCVALAPTAQELNATLPWLEQQDGNPDWPAHARARLAELSQRLGHDGV